MATTDKNRLRNTIIKETSGRQLLRWIVADLTPVQQPTRVISFEFFCKTWFFINCLCVLKFVNVIVIEILADKIYITGGFDGMESLNSVEVYDPETNQWTLIARMRSYRSGCSCIAYNDHIYVIGTLVLFTTLV